MELNDIYLNVKKDLSGTISKNRFSQEYYWGLKKIYNLFTSNSSDFVVIFDYACDIDVISDKIYFYQLKTKKSGRYSVNDLITVKKNCSIISTLYSLYQNDDTLLYVVSNVDFEAKRMKNKKKTPLKIVQFSDLSDSDQESIKNNINEVLGIDKHKINLSNISFISSDISLMDSDNFCLGETTAFLKKWFSSENGAVSFKDYMMNLIKEKATYEYNSNSMDEIKSKKGVSREELQSILDDFMSAKKEDYWDTFGKIEIAFSAKDRLLTKKSINKIISNGFSNGIIKDYESYLLELLNGPQGSLSLSKFILYAAQNKNDKMDHYDSLAFCIIAYTKLGDQYEKNNDI